MSPTPWTIERADHLGSFAYAIRCADGDLIAVGLLRVDAEILCELVNAASPTPTEEQTDV